MRSDGSITFKGLSAVSNQLKYGQNINDACIDWGDLLDVPPKAVEAKRGA